VLLVAKQGGVAVEQAGFEGKAEQLRAAFQVEFSCIRLR
jgi:hypothetical protein